MNKEMEGNQFLTLSQPRQLYQGKKQGQDSAFSFLEFTSEPSVICKEWELNTVAVYYASP